MDRRGKPGNRGGPPQGAGGQRNVAGERKGVRCGDGGGKEESATGVGVHLNLSDGRPAAPADQVTGLLNGKGELDGGPKAC